MNDSVTYEPVPAGDSDGFRCKEEAARGVRCLVCRAPIPRRERGLQVCERRTCRKAMLGATPATAQRRISNAIRAELTSLAISPSGTHRGAIALLPANVRAMEPVTPAIRARFVSTIRTRASQRTNDVQSDPVHDASLLDNATEPLEAVMRLGCALCAGHCCTRGGDHAFLGTHDLRRTAQTMTNGDAGVALESLYTAHIPDAHYAGSCIFHGERGCTLPRALRSDTCNRYLCSGLSTLRKAVLETGAATAVVGAATWSCLERVAVVDASVMPASLVRIL